MVVFSLRTVSAMQASPSKPSWASPISVQDRDRSDGVNTLQIVRDKELSHRFDLWRRRISTGVG
jgi:hypothetical protein